MVTVFTRNFIDHANEIKSEELGLKLKTKKRIDQFETWDKKLMNLICWRDRNSERQVMKVMKDKFKKMLPRKIYISAIYYFGLSESKLHQLIKFNIFLSHVPSRSLCSVIFFVLCA